MKFPKTPKKPQVGIFWVHKGKIYPKMSPADEVQDIQGFKDSPYGHITEWGEMQKGFPALRGKEYDEIPRGRVLWAKDKFKIFMPPNMASNTRMRVRLMNLFDLPRDMTHIQADEHYTLKKDIIWEDD